MPSEPLTPIRPAQAQEAARIRSLVRAERLNPFGLDWRRFFVAVDETGAILGCVQQKTHWRRRQPVVRELASLVVSREWRGQGLGAVLVRHLQEKAGPPLWLMCRARLVPFYEQFAFREQRGRGEMPLYFAIIQTGVDLLTFGRRRSDYLAIMVWYG